MVPRAKRSGGWCAMWFDARTRLAEIEGRPPATSATIATKQEATPPRVAGVAVVAAPPTLDEDGLPFAPCPDCGAGTFWKPADVTPEGPGWRCASCDPADVKQARHACAVAMRLDGPPAR